LSAFYSPAAISAASAELLIIISDHIDK